MNINNKEKKSKIINITSKKTQEKKNEFK